MKDLISILMCIILFYNTSVTVFDEFKAGIMHSLYGNVYNAGLDVLKKELREVSDSLIWYYRL